MDWEDYRVFLAVLRTGGFSSASRTLGMAPATVRRRIESLEARLGIPLFARTPDGLAPTMSARELSPLAEKMEGAASALERAATGELGAPRGLVRVTAGEALGLQVLMPVFAEIRERHPDIRFALGIAPGVRPLLAGAADVAVLLSPPRPDNLVLRSAGRAEVGLFAHRRYLERAGEPSSVEDLSRHALIGTEDAQLADIVEAGMGLRAGPEAFVIVAESVMGQFSAIRAGLGIGFCLSALAAREVDFVRVLPTVSALDLEVTVASHAGNGNIVRVGLVRDAVAEALQAWFHVGDRSRMVPGPGFRDGIRPPALA